MLLPLRYAAGEINSNGIHSVIDNQGLSVIQGRTMSDMSFTSFCHWLKFRHLLLIDTLGRTGNMHLAAEQMSLSQPALSKMLREIENQFGFPLFERLPRSMPPTALGGEVVRYAQIALNDARGFVARIDSLRAGGHGHLRVGGIFAATAVALPQAIISIKKRWPLLAIEVVEQTSDHLMEMLKARTLDLAIGRFTEPQQQQLFDFRPMGPEPFCLVVNRRHPLTGQDRRYSLGELLAWPWILYPQGTPIRRQMEEAFAAAGVATPHNTVETISMQTFLQVLQGGPMIGMLPEAMAAAHLHGGLLSVLNTDLRLAPQEYGVLTRRSEPLTEIAREFMALLLEPEALAET